MVNPVLQRCGHLVFEITRAPGSRNHPHPRPLPEYRAREDGARRKPHAFTLTEPLLDCGTDATSGQSPRYNSHCPPHSPGERGLRHGRHSNGTLPTRTCSAAGRAIASVHARRDERRLHRLARRPGREEREPKGGGDRAAGDHVRGGNAQSTVGQTASSLARYSGRGRG